MSPVSATDSARSRKYLQSVLQRLASVGQVHVATQLATSESTVSRLVSADLERVLQMLVVLGLKVVPCEMKCYPKDQIDAIFTLARASMNRVDDVEQLSFED